MTTPVPTKAQGGVIGWRIKRGLRKLGWSGVAGVAMLLFAAGHFVFAYAPLQGEVAFQKRL